MGRFFFTLLRCSLYNKYLTYIKSKIFFLYIHLRFDMNNPLVLKKNRIFYLITLLGFLYVVYYIFCVSTDKKAFRRNHIDERCQYRVVLEDLSSEKLPDNYVYFIETSGR